MKTDTKYFGEITYEPDELLTFPKGLYGFEDEQSQESEIPDTLDSACIEF